MSFAIAASAADPAPRPQLFAKLVECRSVSDPAQRLACYDTQVSALDAAEKKKDVVMMDRQQVRETRRSLFGFTLPKFSFGGTKEDDEDDIGELESVVASLRPLRNGGWSFVLPKEGGTWETGDVLNFAPRAGDKIKIRKASLGSYLGSVGPNRGVRFRRVG